MTVDSTIAGLSWTAGLVAQELGAELDGPADLPLSRLDTLERADERTLTFIRDARHAARWPDCRAGAAIVSRSARPESHDPSRRALLLVDNADHALIGVLERLAPRHVSPGPAGAHPLAFVDPAASVDPSAALGPGVVVGPGATIGPGTVIHANAVIGADVTIGRDCDIRAGVVIEDRCSLGDRVIIHPNAVIGADGFGYRPAAPGRSNGQPALVKIPHAGAVEIGDDVEIGACTSIDRGKLGSTLIGSGTKIDNLVQIGHNCRIGRNCVICGATGLAGSVTVGDGATIGGGVGVKDNISIGAGAQIAGRAAVMNDIPPKEIWAGYPAAPFKTTMRIVAATRKLPDLLRRLGLDERAERAGGAGGARNE